MHIGPWDIALIVAVSALATVLAYLYHPRWKALTLNLPVPFTLASLALGKPIGATNVMGAMALLLFAHGVRLLHCKVRVPIVPAIILGDLTYCAIGWAAAAVVKETEAAFWVAAILALALGAGFWIAFPHREEPGHRTPLPVHIKLPIIVGVVAILVLIKNSLRGFFTMFPMVSTVAAYEARKSLWAISRQMPVLLLTMVPMMIVAHLSFQRVGLGRSLALGWVVFLAIFIPLTRFTWSRDVARINARQKESELAQEA